MKRYTFRIHLGRKVRLSTYTGRDAADAREVALSSLSDGDKARVTQVTCVSEQPVEPAPPPALPGVLSLVLACLMLAACGGGGGGGYPAPTPVAQKDPEPGKKEAATCRVVLYGDSLLVNPGLEENPGQRIARLRPDWQVDNLGVGGQRSEQGIPFVLSHPPAGNVIVFEWGVNDAKVEAPVDGYPMAIDAMKQRGMKVVVTGVVDIAGAAIASYNAVLQGMASSHGAAFADWHSVPVTAPDGTHPDQASTDRLTDKLLSTLDVECAR